jgi:nitrous oxidase accessory protein
MRRFVLAAALALLLTPLAPVQAASPGEILVCPDCPQRDLAAAIAAAPAGAVIRVRGGYYPGPLVIDRPVTLLGEDWPIIDGGGRSTVVHVAAPEVHLEGFVVRGSGTSHDREDSGILVTAAQARIIGNRVLDSLFGIQLLDAPDGLVQENLVVGKPLPEPQRGDGIKLWYSPRARVVGNHVQDSRDVLVWYSDGTLVEGNLVERGRYGIHFMYSNDSTIERNVLRDNSVGLYLMYGARMTVRGNVFLHNRGPSGHGLALKETDGALVEGNLMLRNRVGLYIDNSPISENVVNRISGNWIAYNDIGLLVSPATRRNVIAGNTMLENIEQAVPQGGGTLQHLSWEENGRGNFWSDYAGYDADRDGIGDLPYESRALSSTLTDRAPLLAFFRFSIAAMALDLAARAVPLFQPPPRLVDPSPLVVPTPWPAVPWDAPAPAPHRAFLSLAVLGLALLPLFPAFRRPRLVLALAGAPVASTPPLARLAPEQAGVEQESAAVAPVIQVHQLRKRYGERMVLEEVSFAVQPGEAVALWGPNGAGKTTILRCLLGRTTYEGTVSVFGRSPLRDGPAVRARIGYVPQQLPLLDLPVGELVTTIAQLRGEPLERAWERLRTFGLEQAWHQPMRTLSGGMQQRLALVLATIADPPLLLLDEPTANLDATAREDLLAVLERLRDEGRTIVFASHRPHDVWRLATRVLRLQDGHLVAESRSVFQPKQDVQQLLVLQLEEEALQPATHLLSAHGFLAYRVGQEVRVLVTRDRKAEPFFLLARVGIRVRDFRLEASDGW